MRRSNRMLLLIFCMTLVLSTFVAANVFMVSVQKTHMGSGTDLSSYVSVANVKTEIKKAIRGNIYDRDGVVIAQDNRTYNIVCVLDENRLAPRGQVAYVDNPEETASVLATLLNGDKDTILGLLTRDVYQTELGLIGRNISREKKEEIESYNLNGVEFTESIQRAYPLGVFASNLIGFAQSDEVGTTVGRMGLELILEEELSGIDGSRTYQADKNGFVLPGMKATEINAVNGYDVTLTLDQEIQEALEEAFLETEETFNATRVWGSVMEVDTGRVLAWGQYPSFEPNKLNIEDYNNYGAQLPYEPGSTMKTFAWAAAIDSGNYDGNKLVNSGAFCYSAKGTNPYRVASGGLGFITNASYNDWGMIEYDYGLIYSANTVTAALLTEEMTPEIFDEYLARFHFFEPVDSDGIREEVGVKHYTWPSEKITMTYGQGSTVTMLQLIQAYSAIFNDGTMVKPYFVERITDSYDSQNIIYQAETTVVGQPISAQTAQQVQDILYRVVNEEVGTGRHYRIPEIEFMGKTGTTQVVVSGSYDSGKTIVSMIAGLPAEDPQYLVYYAFEAPYDKNAHYKTEAIKTLLRKVVIHENLVVTSKEDIEGEKIEIKTESMPTLINHSTAFSIQTLDDLGVETYFIGTGDRVIDQYPSAGSSVVTLQKVFLLTDVGGFYMPDMTGWTRKEVVGFWEVSGVAFKLSGNGKVVYQSVPANSYITKDTEIEVELE